jgi:M-phase inducer tyrosine phosphatase
MDEPMDVDTSYNTDTVLLSALNIVPSSPVPNSAAPTVTGFNQLFYDPLSPGAAFGTPIGHQPKKQRRSLSPSSVRRTMVGESSSPLLSSPSEAKLERIASKATLNAFSKPGLQGLGAPSGSFLKRPRRPVLSAMVGASDHLQAQSAYPTMSAGDFDDNSPRGAVPVRRAFSAFLPPSSLFAGPVSASVLDAHYQLPDDELSFENDGVSAEMSSPAQAYSKRQQVKTIRRCDGTEDFRPLTGATALKQKESPFNGNLNNLSPSSRLMAATGLPGFGDNEAHGKILPCHRVTEDGLMRIKPQTVRMLSSFFVNDC